jgi:hypothetical protein
MIPATQRWTVKCISLIDDHLDRTMLAVELVKQRWRRAAEALEAAGVPYAMDDPDG